MDRTQDLFYQVRVFSSYPFEMNRVGKQYSVHDKIEVPRCIGGGVPSSMTFYKNPQYLICVDQSKFKN